MSLDAFDGVIRTGVAGDLEVGGLLERDRVVGSRESCRGSEGLDVDVVVGAVHRDVGDRAALVQRDVIRRLFLNEITPEEIDMLTGLFSRVSERIDNDTPCP